jgi:FkbM family methyltransferase
MLTPAQLRANARAAADLFFLTKQPDHLVVPLLRLLPHARAQLRQDIFVLAELHLKRGGYFVEFGATNGIDLSNTYLLETQFGWRGIVAEPAQCWQTALARNRACKIDTRCVWRESGATLRFNETNIAELSTIESFSAGDRHAELRKAGHSYEVRTVSLMDLLREHDALRQIDYLSVDTEGSEFDILQAFDFEHYDVRIITCEHNYSPLRDKLHALLTEKGYTRKFEGLSQVDDWYVKQGG